MKLSTCCAALLLALASPAVLAAPGSCERIQSDISQRIINNGVPESSFTLSIVPNDQVDQPDSQVVGHCANDTHKILYTRTTSGNVSAPAQSSQDGAPAEPHYRLNAGYDKSGDLNIQHNPTLLLIPFY